MNRVLSRCVWAACAVAVLLLTPVRASVERPRIVYRELCKLLAVWDPSMRQTSIEAPRPASLQRWHGLIAGNATATFVVNYNGFPADNLAKNAFQAAVDIWATQITSSVPIVINANWTPLATGVLGSAGSNFVYRDFGAGTASTYYHSALADKLKGSDVDPGVADIVASFNSNDSRWYFGTDGNPGGSQYDFESVVLHELGHGLGFSGTGTENNSGVAGCTGTMACWGITSGSTIFPMVYDRFVETSDRRAVINTSIFPNPSVQLDSVFTSEVAGNSATGLFWNGANGVAAAGGGTNRPQLDALSPFTVGSNYSHVSESGYPRGNINSLMTRALFNGESIHNPGPIALGMFQDEGWSLSCSYALSASSATVPPTGTTGNTVTVTAPAGCAWTASAPSGSFVTITGGASGDGNGTVTYSVAAAPSSAVRSTTLTIAGLSFVVTQGPLLSVDHTTLRFGAVGSGGTLSTTTSAQTVGVTITGATGIPWTAAVTSSSPWLKVTGGSGTGSGAFSVSVQSDASLAGVGSATGTITVTSSGTATGSKTITVTLTITPAGTTSGPTGSFDTPGTGTVLRGSVAVTGWALDDIEVTRVQIQRDAHPNDPPGAVFNGRVFIADASFVEGARPDVEAAAPNWPMNYRAGWGYLMLTRGLVWDGKGPFNLYVLATDKEGNTVTIGTKQVTVDNATATAPFGSIDTPGQGGTTSGTFFNFGWGLTPGTCTIPANGVQVSIDSGPLQAVTYGDARPDIAAGFSGFTNSAAAGGHFVIDSTQLSNGSHTIGWLITDNCGRADGVGSRFFKVQNSSLVTTSAALINQPIAALPGVDSGAAVKVATGFDRKTAPRIVKPDALGRRHVRIDELERVEVRPVSALLPSRGGRYTAYLSANGQLRRLPIGSSFDRRKGTLYWQPAAGYVGDYEFVIVDQARRDLRRLTRVMITVGTPRTSHSVTVRAAN